MSKHKRTREQKIKADTRSILASQQLSHTHIMPPTYVFSSSLPKRNESHATEAIDTASIIKHDLIKTALISFSILFLQVLFFFALKSHLLAINFVRY